MFPLTEALAMQGVSIGRGFFGQQRLRCCREEELTTALVRKGALCITANRTAEVRSGSKAVFKRCLRHVRYHPNRHWLGFIYLSLDS